MTALILPQLKNKRVLFYKLVYKALSQLNRWLVKSQIICIGYYFYLCMFLRIHYQH